MINFILDCEKESPLIKLTLEKLNDGSVSLDASNGYVKSTLLIFYPSGVIHRAINICDKFGFNLIDEGKLVIE